MDMVQRRAVGTDWKRILSGGLPLEWLCDLIGVQPVDHSLYQRALTHGSTGKPDYQRLEFLGDRILGLMIAEMLYTRFPDEAEGRLSHRLNPLVSGQCCAKIARQIGLPKHIFLGKQARDDGAHDSDNVLGDILESLIGAVYLDHGISVAHAFVDRLWSPLIDTNETAPKHPKSALQEYCAAMGRKIPEYLVTRKEGPPHAMRFEVTVTVKGFQPVSAEAASKQAAETAAALAFLEQNT
jgi:ribonuclease III